MPRNPTATCVSFPIADVGVSSGDDLGEKMELYSMAGVREYLMLLVAPPELRWYRLVDDNYQLMSVPADGVLRSYAFPGLWLDRAALLDGNMARVLTVLQQGLQSAEHAAFVAQLVKRQS